MKAIIIEDEKKNIVHLKGLLKQFPVVELVGEAGDAVDGLELIARTQPDLLFLDIHLPGKSGFELLASIGEYRFEVIFITAYDQYGIQAIKFSALDYLLKPVKFDELYRAIQKAAKRTENNQTGEQIRNLLSIVTENKKDHRIALSLMKEIRFVNPIEIIRFEAANNYTNIYLESGEKLLVSKGLFEFSELLDDYHFIRCHQSHLVNRKFIKSILKEDTISELLLTDGSTRIPVSRLKKDEVKEKLINS